MWGSLPVTVFDFILIAILALTGTRIQFYLDCLAECGSGSTNLHESGSYAPRQAKVCILTDFRCGEEDLFWQLSLILFWLPCWLSWEPHSECRSGSPNLHDTGPYAPGQAEVCILTNFWCGIGDLFRKLSLILFLLPYWHSWEPALWMRNGTTNLCDIGPYAPGRAEVCILTNFRCGEGDLFQQLSLILFLLPYWHPWTRIPNTYPDPQTYMILDPMHLTKQEWVSLLTFWCGKRDLFR